MDHAMAADFQDRGPIVRKVHPAEPSEREDRRPLSEQRLWKGLSERTGGGLGAAAGRMIVARASYEPTSPTVDSEMATLASSKATVFFNASSPKFAAQAIRKAAELNWKPTQVLALPSASIQTVLDPAGLNHSVGIISSTY